MNIVKLLLEYGASIDKKDKVLTQLHVMTRITFGGEGINGFNAQPSALHVIDT